MFFVVEVHNTQWHAGKPITAEDVKQAIEGDGCSTDCETRHFQVPRIIPFEWKPKPPCDCVDCLAKR